MKTALVTGANRGIGLEFCKQLISRQINVIATCRDPKSAIELKQLESSPLLKVFELDIRHSIEESSLEKGDNISKLLSEINKQPLDWLINNAGVYGKTPQHLDNLNNDDWLETLLINAISPILLTHKLLPNLKLSQKAKIAFLTSKMGSMSDNGSGGAYVYRSSKAALNASIKSLSIDLTPHKIPVVALHPGWVKTEMGGQNALISTEQSVCGMLNVIDSLSVETTGCFKDYSGNVIPW